MILTIPLYAQSINDQQRIAIAYEQAGDWRNAARIWQDLLKQQPTNSTFLAGALRALKSLGNTAAIIELTESSPEAARSWEVLAYHGYALYRQGKQQDAIERWEYALNRIKPNSETPYRLLASLQLEAGALSQAAQTFQEARRRLDNQMLFAEELTQLAIAASNIPAALEEILRYFDVSQNLARTEGYLTTLLSLDNTKSSVLSRISSYAERNRTSINALRLYEWTLRELGNYPAALEVVSRIEQLTGESGRELYGFAERARNEGAYDIALTAYAKLLDMDTPQDIRTIALYGHVQTLEQSLFLRGVTPVNLDRIIAEYERIVQDYPSSVAAANSLLRIAVLWRDYRKDLPGALERFERLFKTFPASEQAAQGRIERLPLIIQMLGIDSAATLFEHECQDVERFARLRDYVHYIRAELEFFRCRYQQALVWYRQVSANPNTEYANDALERATLLTINQNDSTRLCMLAHAALKFYLHQWSEAFALTDSVAHDDSDLAEYALMAAGSQALEAGILDRCQQYFIKLLEGFPETIYGDRALWSLGQVAQRTGNTTQALMYYNQLLAQFPTSIFIPQARINIRLLRGDL